MGRLVPNQRLAVEVLDRLLALGVRTFCLCPGGRNAPLVEALDALPAAAGEALDFFEERSAAFFALGRARRDRRPVAVITTSGTAAAELLPAMVEAYYSCTPLVAVTADRPRAYRGTGAPQTIEQADLFGVHARQRVDLDRAGTTWRFDLVEGPSHLNVCFDEPLLEGWQREAHETCAAPPLPGGRNEEPLSARESYLQRELRKKGRRDAVAAALQGCTRPLVLVGALSRVDDQYAVVSFCRDLRAPVLAEASSHVKFALRGQLLVAGERAARHGFEQGVFDSVIRLGDIPSFRLWRDLEETWRVPLVSVSRKPWPGVTHGVHLTLAAADSFVSTLPDFVPFPADEREALLAFDRETAALTESLLDQFPDSEPAHVRRLSRQVPGGAFVYLGNSLPIREWNQFAAIDDRELFYGENRGANGIDGQLSTFFGGAFPGRENWAIVGDLTALYDLAAPWALRHVDATMRLVVINNCGGRIFQRLFANPRFQNRHRLSLEPVASLWGLEYARGLPVAASSRAALVELRPSEEETNAFWAAMHTGSGG